MSLIYYIHFVEHKNVFVCSIGNPAIPNTNTFLLDYTLFVRERSCTVITSLNKIYFKDTIKSIVYSVYIDLFATDEI